MDNRQCLVLIRGQKPLKGEKIITDELAGYAELRYTRVADYVPAWREMDEAEAVMEVEDEIPEPSAPTTPKVKVGGDEVVFDAEEYAEVDAQDIIDE